jgi:hypothetical protein
MTSRYGEALIYAPAVDRRHLVKRIDQIREFWLSTLLDSFGYFCEKTAIQYKPYGAFRLKDEAGYILKN